jgi:hypothetical protein
MLHDTLIEEIEGKKEMVGMVKEKGIGVWGTGGEGREEEELTIRMREGPLTHARRSRRPEVRPWGLRERRCCLFANGVQ